MSETDLHTQARPGSVEIPASGVCDQFNAGLLGLGDLKRRSDAIEAVAAMFDLEGFTNFCKQIDPHLSVPLFLSSFLDWLLGEIKAQLSDKQVEEGGSLHCPLPFFVKFMGDGILALWNVSNAPHAVLQHIIASSRTICQRYIADFLPHISRKVIEAPKALRCGLARGTVFSVGDAKDYVGSCINMAARLQKLPGVTFAFNVRGIDCDDRSATEFCCEKVVIKRVAVRGIGDELVGLVKSEYAAMRARDRKAFQNV